MNNEATPRALNHKNVLASAIGATRRHQRASMAVGWTTGVTRMLIVCQESATAKLEEIGHVTAEWSRSSRFLACSVNVRNAHRIRLGASDSPKRIQCASH